MDRFTRQLRKEVEATLWLNDVFSDPFLGYYYQEPATDALDDEYNALIAEHMIPIKAKAVRHKKTVRANNRKTNIDKYVRNKRRRVSKEEYEPKKNVGKDIRINKSWYTCNGCKDIDLKAVMAEGVEDYDYECHKSEFYNLVDQFLTTKYVLKWSELEETDYIKDLGEIYDIVDESLEFDNIKDVHLHIAEAFNEEWEPICYEIVKMSCGTEELIDQWFSDERR